METGSQNQRILLLEGTLDKLELRSTSQRKIMELDRPRADTAALNNRSNGKILRGVCVCVCVRVKQRDRENDFLKLKQKVSSCYLWKLQNYTLPSNIIGQYLHIIFCFSPCISETL